MLASLKSGLLSFSSALVASLCCLLPVAVVLLGLGTGAFMMVTMQYQWLFLPIGILGVAAGYYLYFREARRCSTIGCAFASRKLNATLLAFATVLLGAEIVLAVFPDVAAKLLQNVM